MKKVKIYSLLTVIVFLFLSKKNYAQSEVEYRSIVYTENISCIDTIQRFHADSAMYELQLSMQKLNNCTQVVIELQDANHENVISKVISILKQQEQNINLFYETKGNINTRIDIYNYKVFIPLLKNQHASIKHLHVITKANNQQILSTVSYEINQ